MEAIYKRCTSCKKIKESDGDFYIKKDSIEYSCVCKDCQDKAINNRRPKVKKPKDIDFYNDNESGLYC